MTKLKLYTASTLDRAQFWRDLALDWPEIEFCASWFRQDFFAESEPGACRKGWLRDMRDVSQCDVLMVYGAHGKTLRGALVEAGVALALGKPVIVMGDHESYGTWQFHPGVVRLGSFVQAREWLKGYAYRLHTWDEDAPYLRVETVTGHIDLNALGSRLDFDFPARSA